MEVMTAGVAPTEAFGNEGTAPFGWALDFRNVFTWWIMPPPPQVHASPQLAKRIREIKRFTNWSDRQLARALSVSHPTVAALAAGRGPGRPETTVRIADVHDVVERIFLVCNRDPQLTDAILRADSNDEANPVRLLRRNETAKAYLAALDRIHPRQPGMLTSRRTRTIGRDTASLVD
jgi:transcriptional regulator with XRE-family HTH domain